MTCLKVRAQKAHWAQKEICRASLTLTALIVAVLTFVFLALVSAAPAKTFTAKGIACHHAETIGRLTQLAVDGDRNVFAAYAVLEIFERHECIELSGGTTITIESADPENIAICVRPAGEVDCLWMTPEAISGLTPEELRDALKQP
jgi:hypothetical protein